MILKTCWDIVLGLCINTCGNISVSWLWLDYSLQVWLECASPTQCTSHGIWNRYGHKAILESVEQCFHPPVTHFWMKNQSQKFESWVETWINWPLCLFILTMFITFKKVVLLLLKEKYSGFGGGGTVRVKCSPFFYDQSKLKNIYHSSLGLEWSQPPLHL